MPTTRSMRRVYHTVTSLALLAPIAVAPRPAVAQAPSAPGVLTVTVRDSSGAGIADAQLQIPGTTVRGETDERGAIRLAGLGIGPTRLEVRRLGFRPASLQVTVTPGTTAASITLVRVARQLAPILVRGTTHEYSARLAGFYERRRLGIGHFFTRADIEKEHVLEFTDLFRRIPGMEIVSTDVIRHAVRMRGEDCAPLVRMDGAPLAAAEFDLDALAPESVEAMEVYSGVAEVPAGMMGPNGLGSCGVIVIWSRVGERRPKTTVRTVSPAQLAALVASLDVYTANEVDVPARLDSSAAARPAYPDSLLAAHVNGQVTAEFVVDTTGRVLMGTFGAISSTHPAFTEAVRRVLPDASYIPASLDGRLVKQIVYQPFTFVADSTAAPSRQ